MINSMYIHVPFCRDICAYCDFTRVKIHPILVEKYLATLKKEIDAIQPHIMDTLYIGGGTPTSLTMDELESLLSFLEGYHDASTEFTMEANPESMDLEKAQLIAMYGVNRVSMGVQTFNQEELNLLNRKHDNQDIKDAVACLHTVGISNISIDLIYGLPTQTLASWEETLKQALMMGVSHISLYSLTIEENSQFGRSGIRQADPDLEADMYFKAVEVLSKAGFHRYEISSFTRDKPSRHNLAYWHYDEFYGLGPGATQMIDHIRTLKTTNLDDYAKGKTMLEETKLTKDDECFEFMMMGLRLSEGIDLERFALRFGIRAETMFRGPIEDNIAKKRLELSSGRLCCTDIGLALLNDVLVSFLPDTP
jgi:oxygen-independent coproporphyrinogen III oxidase